MKNQRLTLAVIAVAAMQACATAQTPSADSVVAPPPVAVQPPAEGATQAVPAPAVPSGSSSPPASVKSVDDSSGPKAVTSDAAATAADSRVAPETPVSNAPRIIRGNDKVIADPKATPALEGASMSFRFEEAPISDVITLVMKDVVKSDYVMHQPITGTVTMSTQADVSPDQAMLLLESALQANGLALVRDPRGTYHIGKPETLRGIVPGIRLASPLAPLPPGSGPIIVPLQYIGAHEMAAILKPLLPADALLRVDALRNLLILAGNRNQAEGWLDIVATFDVSLLKGMSVGLFPLKYASTKDVDAALRLLSGNTGASGSASAAGGAPGMPQAGTAATGGAASAGAGASSATALAESFPLFGAVRIMPIEKMNSILVVTPRAAYLEEARQWIEKFDQPGGNSSEPQLYIYPVQNGNAKHLAAVIGGLFGGSSTTANGSQGTGVAPSLTSNTQQSSGFGAFAAGSASTSSTGSAFGSSFGSTGSSSGFGTTGTAGFGGVSSTANSSRSTGNQSDSIVGFNLGGVRIVSDDLNNAILIYGTRGDYLKIESALKRLDIAPIQVLIEASIIEVTLSDQLTYGLQWAFSNKIGNGTGNGALTSSSTSSTGFSYTVLNSSGAIKAVLNALAGKQLLKVISSPSLMVLDNNTATITVGTQQPIQSATTVVTGGIVSNSIQYKDTGVSLTVKPSVTAGDMVTMDLVQNVTDLGAATDPATGQYPFQERQVTSKVAVRSGQNLVLGGLIRDNASKSSSGLPILSSLPVVGGLFGTQGTTGTRTELLVVLSPRVIRSDLDARDASEELRDRMKSFNGFDALSNLRPDLLSGNKKP